MNLLHKINLVSGFFILVQVLFPEPKIWKVVKIIQENIFGSKWRTREKSPFFSA
jgi:hypothetical protein